MAMANRSLVVGQRRGHSPVWQIPAGPASSRLGRRRFPASGRVVIPDPTGDGSHQCCLYLLPRQGNRVRDRRIGSTRLGVGGQRCCSIQQRRGRPSRRAYERSIRVPVMSEVVGTAVYTSINGIVGPGFWGSSGRLGVSSLSVCSLERLGALFVRLVRLLFSSKRFTDSRPDLRGSFVCTGLTIGALLRRHVSVDHTYSSPLSKLFLGRVGALTNLGVSCHPNRVVLNSAVLASSPFKEGCRSLFVRRSGNFSPSRMMSNMTADMNSHKIERVVVKVVAVNVMDVPFLSISTPFSDGFVAEIARKRKISVPRKEDNLVLNSPVCHVVRLA